MKELPQENERRRPPQLLARITSGEIFRSPGRRDKAFFEKPVGINVTSDLNKDLVRESGVTFSTREEAIMVRARVLKEQQLGPEEQDRFRQIWINDGESLIWVGPSSNFRLNVGLGIGATGDQNIILENNTNTKDTTDDYKHIPGFTYRLTTFANNDRSTQDAMNNYLEANPDEIHGQTQTIYYFNAEGDNVKRVYLPIEVAQEGRKILYKDKNYVLVDSPFNPKDLEIVPNALSMLQDAVSNINEIRVS